MSIRESIDDAWSLSLSNPAVYESPKESTDWMSCLCNACGCWYDDSAFKAHSESCTGEKRPEHVCDRVWESHRKNRNPFPPCSLVTDAPSSNTQEVQQ